MIEELPKVPRISMEHLLNWRRESSWASKLVAGIWDESMKPLLEFKKPISPLPWKKIVELYASKE
ncbi:hypothetical protein MUO93_03575, partial [Candidatus Bathyarchaeota archaeon]|nr:hypothetical protein [Candidatus Bathyarchaeota archaeon]